MKINPLRLLVLATAMLAMTSASGGALGDGLADLARTQAGFAPTAQTVDPTIEGLAKSRAADVNASGHGLEAGIADIEVSRAEKKVEAERQERTRMELEAEKQEEVMERECRCIIGSCSSGLSYTVTRTCSFLMGEELNQCQREEREEQAEKKAMDAWRASHQAEIEEENRRQRAAKDAQKKVCKDWKAAGPMANSESFKAQLRQQDLAIAEAKRIVAENARQRDALIEADVKRTLADADRIEADRLKTEDDKRASQIAAQHAEQEESRSKAAAREEELRVWCMEDQRRLDTCACGRYSTLKMSTCTK